MGRRTAMYLQGWRARVLVLLSIELSSLCATEEKEMDQSIEAVKEVIEMCRKCECNAVRFEVANMEVVADIS